MNTYADKKQENKSQSVANAVSQKRRSSEYTFQLVDNRPEVIAQRKLQKMMNSSSHAQKITQLQVIANTHTVQRFPFDKDGNDLGAVSGFKDGLKTSTIDRLGLPSPKLGSMFSFKLLGSALITPLLSDRPAIPSQIKPYASGFFGGFLSGTMARKFMFKAVGVPGVIDSLMTVSNVNKTAVKIDTFLSENPNQRPIAEKFVSEVMERAAEQHKQTNPYMTPNSPDSMAEIQSLF